MLRQILTLTQIFKMFGDSEIYVRCTQMFLGT